MMRRIRSKNNLPTVVCYFEDLQLSNSSAFNATDIQGHKELIEMWKKSWSKNGWQPLILGRKDTERHPDYSAVNLKDPKSNLFKYSLLRYIYQKACYAKWFAYAAYANEADRNIMWADFDVINYHFNPQMTPKLKDKNDIQPFTPSFCCGYTGAKGLNAVIDGIKRIYCDDQKTRIFAQKMADRSKKKGRKIKVFDRNEPPASVMFNDMRILNDIVFPNMNYERVRPNRKPLCVGADVKKIILLKISPLVHFHHGIAMGLDSETRKKYVNKRSDLIKLIRDPEKNWGVSRSDLINQAVSTISAKSYLEIGVQKGINFNKIICEEKVGVEPYPKKHQPTHTMTSDEFFKKFPDNKFDVISIDGEHTKDAVKKIY